MSGSSRVSEGVEGVDFPADAIPLRSKGPEMDVINIDDESSDMEAARSNDDEEEEEGDDAEREEEEPVASTSQVEGASEVDESSKPKAKPKRKIIQLDPDIIPDRTGKEPCPYWDCFVDQRAVDVFRRFYFIPNDVIITPVKSSRILFGDEHVTVPLMAITEGGLRFPMHRILREVLFFFGLTPCQLRVNSYRIIHSIIKLAEVKMFPLQAHHIFENYMLSRNVRFSRYFLCSRRNMEKIIPEGMYDSEKWASNYVEIRGNFQYPPDEYGEFEVATRRGEPCKRF